MRVLFCVVALLVATASDAVTPYDTPPLASDELRTPATTTNRRSDKATQVTRRAQQKVAAGGDAFARWIDAFFDNPRVEAEEASSRIELRETLTMSERASNTARTRVSAKLHLPNLSERWSLFVRGVDDEGELEDGAAQVLDDPDENVFDDPSLGLQYVIRQKQRLHTSFSVGTRLDNPSVNFGPRLRYSHSLSSRWRGRYTQRVLWDTDEGWESRTRFEFDRDFSNTLLMRLALRADWRESRKSSEGIRYTLRSALVQRLQKDAAVSYNLTSRYTTKPRKAWTAHRASVQYRRQIWQDWIYLEVAPFVAFEKQYNWHPNPGIQLSLDFIFTHYNAL